MTPRELPEPDALVLAVRLIGVSMERDALSAQVKQLIARLAEVEAVLRGIAADCRRGAHEQGMTPAGVQDIARRCDAAIAQEAGRESASAATRCYAALR